MKKKRTTKSLRKTKKPPRKRHVRTTTRRHARKSLRRTGRKTKRKDPRMGVTRAVRLMRQRGLSLAKAARTAGVSPRTVQKLAGSALRKGPNGRYDVRPHDRFERVVYALTDDGIHEVRLKSSRDASVIGEHWNAVHAHVARGESAGLSRFEGVHVRDVDGTRFGLSTDIAAIERLANAGVLSFETIYARTR